MAKVQGTFYTAERLRSGTSPVSPPYSEDEGQPYPVNPPGSGVQTYLTLADTKDGNYLGKNGFVPVVTNEDGLKLEPLPQVSENGLISGGIVQWTGIGYVFNVSGAFYRIGGILYESPAVQITLDAPDATNNRIDVFAVSTGSVALDITGSPSGSPVKPQIDPATQLELTSVIVTAATTEPTLTEEVIYDENIEWTGSSSGTGTVAFNSAANPFQGSLSIEATNIQNGLKIRLTDGSDYDLSGVQTLGMQLDLKAQMFAGQNIGVTFLDSTGAAISTELTLNFDKISTDYQFIGIAISQFSFTSFLARSIELRYIRTKGATVHAGFFLDIIKLEGGINPPVTAGSFISLTDTPSSYSGQASKVVSVKADESGLEFTTPSSGGVQSVTGDGVDNTDPDNPVIVLADIATSGSPYDLAQEGATDGQVVTWVAANSRYEPVTFSGGSPPIDGNYASQAAMIAAQGSQTAQYIYFDSSQYWEYLGTTAGTISDYRAISYGISSLTTNFIPKATSAVTIGDSRISDSGTVIESTGGIFVNGILTTDEILRLGEKTGKQRFFSFQNGNNVQWRVNIDGTTTRDVSTDPSYSLAIDSRSGGAGFSIFYWPPTTGGPFNLFSLNTTQLRVNSSTGVQAFFINVANGDTQWKDGARLFFGTTSGIKIGATTLQKIGFWNTTPIIQPTTSITAAAFVAGGGSTITDTDTFGGYTIAQIAAVLKNTGLML